MLFRSPKSDKRNISYELQALNMKVNHSHPSCTVIIFKINSMNECRSSSSSSRGRGLSSSVGAKVTFEADPRSE